MNMNTQHTPGPWYLGNTSNDQGLVYSERTGKSVAITYDKADGPLVAAAPELFEACINLVNLILELDFEGFDTRGESVEEWTREALSAINKATTQ